MSAASDALFWAASDQKLPHATYRVLIALARRVNNKRGDYAVWPSLDCIAEDARVSRRKAVQAIEELEQSGYLTRGKRGRNNGNIYTLLVSIDGGGIGQRKERKGAENAQPGDALNALMGSAENAQPGDALNAPELYEEGTIKKELYEGELFSRAQAPASEPVSSAIEQSLPSYVHERWNEIAKRFPMMVAIRKLTPSRTRAINARARDFGGPPRAVWDEIFEKIESSLFLTGRAAPSRDRSKPFELSLDWMTTPANFTKTIEGAYNDRHGTRAAHRETFDPETGRRFSATEQAARDAYRNGSWRRMDTSRDIGALPPPRSHG